MIEVESIEGTRGSCCSEDLMVMRSQTLLPPNAAHGVGDF